MKVVTINYGNMSRKNAERAMKFVRLEYEAQRALEEVDPEFAKEFSIDAETIKRLETLYERKRIGRTNSTGPR